MKSILVICEGNICRSPMAQALFAHASPEAQVHSAGLGAMVGMAPDPIAVRLMKDRGLDIAPYRAVQVTAPLCTAADVILVMEAQQRERMLRVYPHVRGKVFRIGDPGDFDVEDPYRRGEAAFRQALAEIERGVTDWLTRIQQLQ